MNFIFDILKKMDLEAQFVNENFRLNLYVMNFTPLPPPPPFRKTQRDVSWHMNYNLEHIPLRPNAKAKVGKYTNTIQDLQDIFICQKTPQPLGSPAQSCTMFFFSHTSVRIRTPAFGFFWKKKHCYGFPLKKAFLLKGWSN